MTSPFDPAFSLTPLHIELFVACGYTTFIVGADLVTCEAKDARMFFDDDELPIADFCRAYPNALVAVPAADLLPLGPPNPKPSDLPPYRRGVRDALAYLQRTGVDGVAADQALREAGALEQAKELRDEHDRAWGRLARLLEVVPDGHLDEPAFTRWLDGVKREAATAVKAASAAAAREATEKQRAADREAVIAARGAKTR